MASRPLPSRILVTGAAGFLGRHLVEVLSEQFHVRSFDVKKTEMAADAMQGSVTDADAVRQALQDMDGLVIAHMFPNRPGNYDAIGQPLDVNVKGAALLLEECVRQGVRRVVLISSTATVQGHLAAGRYLSNNLPPQPTSIYGLTKVLQEATARFFHEKHGLEIAVLRPAYVALGDTMEDKYGLRRPSVNWQAIDPRDIGRAAAGALGVPDLGFEVFHVVAGPGAEERTDVHRTSARLGWEPHYRFAQFPPDEPPAAK